MTKYAPRVEQDCHAIPRGWCSRHIGWYLHTCPGCHFKFHSRRPHASTCSPRCRQRISRRERAEHE
jgi:hypothetical protein